MLTCGKIVFKYEKNLPFFLLELHIGQEETKKLEKQIKNNNQFVIDTQLTATQENNTRYKYVIEKLHSCEVKKDVLEIKFDGKVYTNDRLIDTQSKHFIVEDGSDDIVIKEQLYTSFHRYVGFSYTFSQQQKTEQKPVVRGDEAEKKVRFAEEVKLFSTNTSSSFASTDDSLSGDNKGENPPHEPSANTDCNTSIYCPLGLFAAGCLAMAGGAVLCFADRPDIGGILMASAVACLLIVGIAKLCEKVSEKKQKDPDISTPAAVKSVFSGIFCSEVPANTNSRNT